MNDFSSSWGNYLLEGLAETNAPDPISWLPQTIGWYCLLFLILTMIASKTYRKYKLYQHNIYRRNALNWLSKLPRYDATCPNVIYRQVPSLLRKVALCSTTMEDIRLLSSSDWERWLDEQCLSADNSSMTHFNSKNAQLLYQLSYNPHYQIDNVQMTNLLSDITTWIKYHRGQYD